MASRVKLTYEEARDLPKSTVLRVARERGCKLDYSDRRVTSFLEDAVYQGYLVELEHGTMWGEDSPANVTNNDTSMTVGIAWAHILEDPVYYTRLENMEIRSEHFLDLLKTGKACEINKFVKVLHDSMGPSRANLVKKEESAKEEERKPQRVYPNVNSGIEQF